MTRQVVSVQNVSMRFRELRVLDAISFDVGENELVCIVGPSGCGKTTLANIIAGILEPTEGAVYVEGARVDPRKHSLSHVFQEPSCLPWRTVLGNTRVGLEVKKVASSDRRAREMLKIVGLEGFDDYFPHQLSGGMKQRVALARAFCVAGSLMVLDEPFGSLDAQTRYYMQKELLALWERMKRTVIFITNNIEEAVTLADKLIVLSSLPAIIEDSFSIDLSRPRDVTGERFLSYRRRVYKAM